MNAALSNATLNVPSLPDGLSMMELSKSELPGSLYARYAVDAKHISTQVHHMTRAIEEYAIAQGYDVIESKRIFLYAQMSVIG
jgi:hypothetical protein